jgi:hypothetical protein
MYWRVIRLLRAGARIGYARQAGRAGVTGPLAGATGEAQAQFLDGNFTIRDLSGVKGAAIVIHAGPDNYANIPTRYAANGVAGPDAETQMTGDAGARLACGVTRGPPVTNPGPRRTYGRMRGRGRGHG